LDVATIIERQVPPNHVDDSRKAARLLEVVEQRKSQIWLELKIGAVVEQADTLKLFDGLVDTP
jgi:hypothetical protein